MKPLSPRVKQSLATAEKISTEFGQSSVGVDHIFVAMIKNHDFIRSRLTSVGADVDVLIHDIEKDLKNLPDYP